jgi:3-oxoacyl-[acyl-carrier protein] reductase
MKAAGRHLMRSKAGRVINISSVAGLIGNAGQANYGASKAGLVALTKTAARELGSRGVCVNAVAPGFIRTDMAAKVDPKVVDGVVAQLPLRRMGEAAEIASTVVFLASEQAAYITGQVIVVDGGMAM